jgi:hypothetical protein
MRWLNAAEQAQQVLKPAAMVTVVDDRESDFYAKWVTVPEPGIHMLTRTMQGRRLATGGLLFAAAAAFPVAGTRSVELPARDPGKPRAHRRGGGAVWRGGDLPSAAGAGSLAAEDGTAAGGRGARDRSPGRRGAVAPAFAPRRRGATSAGKCRSGVTWPSCSSCTSAHGVSGVAAPR